MREKIRSIYGPLLALILPIVVYEWLRSSSTTDIEVRSVTGHFYVVSIIAALAVIVAIAVGVTGLRLRNIKVEFLSLAYLSLAGVFLLHGVATPGVMLHDRQIAGIAAQLSILIAVIWLCLSAASSDHPIVRFLSKWRRWILPVWLIVLFSLFYIGVIYPNWLGLLPLNHTIYQWVVAAIATVACLWAMHRYWRSYRSTRFPLQEAMVYSLGYLIVAQYIMVTSCVWKLSWWFYHLLLLSSMIMVLVGLIRQYFSRGSIASSLRVLFQTDPRAWLEACITPSVRALIMATEAHDAYTAGHNMRVALYALRLAEEMNLSEDQLRAIAQGGVVHDVGKLKVPDSILNKPGKLTIEERNIMELHPVSGYDMCKRLGFMNEELSVIRSHHEKWDGTGYPDRLSEERIPLLARITAIADVYDALTSSRSYRQAMSHDEAMAIIKAGSGTHFDPSCVDAWVKLSTEVPFCIEEINTSAQNLRLIKKIAN